MQEVRENFVLKFDGEALASHEIPVSILADALVALQGIAMRANKLAHGRDAEMSMKVRGGFSAGSFEIQLILDFVISNPLAVLGATSSVVGVIVGAVQLYKWAKGKKISIVSTEETTVTVQNENSETAIFNNCTVSLYQIQAIRGDFSRLTSPLDIDGVESVSIINDCDNDEIISKDDRDIFKTHEGITISDHTVAVQLEVIMPSLDGSPKGWRFYEGEGGVSFSAAIEDEAFLEEVKTGLRSFKRGTCLLANLRTTQKKLQRTVTERTIVDVLQFMEPAPNQPPSFLYQDASKK